MRTPTKTTGTIKWFDDKKGFGFIENQSGQDVFLHHSEILVDGYRRTREGDGVKYIEVKTDKGLSATAVEVYESNWPLEQDFKVRKQTAYESE